MSNFTKYFTMKESDVLIYAREKVDYFNADAKLICKEIGDGNLNYIFRIIDENTEKSLIIKQAGPVARISDEFIVSTDRNRIESKMLEIQYKLAPGFVPVLYKYDEIMNCFVMEDLSQYSIMRNKLINHKIVPNFGENISTFLANTLLLTSDVVINHKEKKELQKEFINPDLCEISEDLVFTEPFFDCERNNVLKTIRDFVKKEIWEDEKLLLETGKLKFDFMTNAQSLIHGDLHTGSIFVKEDSIKIIDPEFGFYGPAGYDIGNIVANLIFAYQNGDTTIKNEQEKREFKNWIQTTISETIDLFKEKFLKLWNKKDGDKVTNYNGFKEYYIDSIISYSAGITGCELIRRTIGIANVKDITSITDIEKRSIVEKEILSIGKRFILERDCIKRGQDFVNIIESV